MGKNWSSVQSAVEKECLEIVVGCRWTGAVQCGFCTSGMVMAIKSFKDRCDSVNHVPDRDEIKKNLEGNICRCTGYVKIIDSAEALF